MTTAMRRAFRQFLTPRGFPAAAVLTLAIGIGGTTAILTLIEAVAFRPLPVSEPGRLYRIGDGAEGRVEGGPPGRWGMFSFPLYERLQAAAPEFEQTTAFDWGGTQLSVRRQGSDAAPRPLRAEYVTGSYFSTLGVGAFSGRVLARDDDRLSAPPVVVLSHHAWLGTYGGDPSVVGSTLIIEDHPFTAIGVAAPGFFGETIRADPPALWIPLQQEPLIAGRGSLLKQSASAWLRAIGRLRRNASTDGIAPRLSETLREWIRTDAGYPSSWMADIVRTLPQQTIAVVPAGAGIGLEGLSANEQYGPTLQILLVICAIVLMIACANVANLLLVRAVSRRTQTAVRLALGAGRRQIVAEALAESVLLGAAGAIAGLPVALATARLLVALAFRSAQFVPIATAPSLLVLALVSGLAVMSGVVFGAAPAWYATHTDPIDALRGAGPISDPSSRARTVLLVVQATLSVVLVAGATLLARSAANLQNQDFGYRVEGRVAVGLNRLPASYAAERLSALYRDVERRLARVPGVRGVGLALYNPLTSNWGATIRVAGHEAKPRAESGASFDRVSADYLRQLGIGVLRGRAFTAADDETMSPVAIVNEAFVRRFFSAGEDPLDQRFGIDTADNDRTFRIVGVVRDARFVQSALAQPARPMFYLPLTQRVDYADGQSQLLERLSHFLQGIILVTDMPAGTLEPLVGRTLADADPNLTVTTVRTMQQQIDLAFGRERTIASLAQLFAMVALVLAAVGVYAVTAYSVARQTPEIGVRMALGADGARVIRMVLRRALASVAAGLLVGVPLAVGAAKLMASRLYGVTIWDPTALIVGGASLAVCALLAALVPASRAAAISPMSALRNN